MKRSILAVLGTIVAAAGGISAWVFLSLPPLCGNDIAEDVRSPNAQHRAILFQRACGATTGFSTQVSIIGSSEDLPNEAGNVFIADGALRNGSWTIHWDDPETLVITVNPGARIYMAATSVDGIAILYKLKEQGD